MVKTMLNFFCKNSKISDKRIDTIENNDIFNKIKPFFTSISPDNKEILKKSLIENFYNHQIPFLYNYPADTFLNTEAGKNDINNHIDGRINEFRSTLIPWLNSFIELRNKNIMEIGCGTGSSTISLAEQGANVFGIDIDEKVLEVAKLRANLHKLNNSSFVSGNACALDDLTNETFDIVIFFASLEHMTLEEKIQSLCSAWDKIKLGGYLCVYETPNRLHYHDNHTSLMNFYHWLPDDLAYEYSKFSDRAGFNNLHNKNYEDNKIQFTRWGRGISYHEFELAISPISKLNIVSDMNIFLRSLNKELNDYWNNSIEGDYEKLLSRISPEIHPAFFQPNINILIKKQ